MRKMRVIIDNYSRLCYYKINLIVGGTMSIISVKNLTFRYDGSLENVFENVSFNIDTDWKLGLIGRNGKGKTTFLKLLLGEYEYKGTITKSVEFDYFPFEVKDKERMSIEIVNEIAPSVEDWQIIKELNLLNTDAEILLLDNPTQGIDVGAKAEIYKLILELAKQGKTILINTLEIPEIQKVADYCAVFYNGEIIKILEHQEIDEMTVMMYSTNAAQAEEGK